jgi:hypothetical protein
MTEFNYNNCSLSLSLKRDRYRHKLKHTFRQLCYTTPSKYGLSLIRNEIRASVFTFLYHYLHHDIIKKERDASRNFLQFLHPLIYLFHSGLLFYIYKSGRYVLLFHQFIKRLIKCSTAIIERCHSYQVDLDVTDQPLIRCSFVK